MTQPKLIETSSGKYSLLLNAGDTAVDRVVEGLGHVPHGYFWAAIAQLLVDTKAPALKGKFGYDPEAGMFCAYGTDRAALDELRVLLGSAASDPDQIRKLVALATDKGMDLDD